MNNGLLGFSELANASTRTGAVTSTSSATNVVLSTTANQTQNIFMTAANLVVVMPNASQFAYGNNPIFLIRNTGTNAFDVQDSTGQTIFAALAQNKSVIVWLRDNTTAAGSWSLLSNQAVQTILNTGTVATVTANQLVGNPSIVQLNSTQALIVYIYSNYAIVAVLTLTGTSIAVGTQVGLNNNLNLSGFTNKVSTACLVGTGQVLVALGDGRLYGVTISGTTCTVTGTVPFALPCESVSIASAGTGVAIITYQLTSDHTISSCVVTFDSSLNFSIGGVAVNGSVGAMTSNHTPVAGSTCISNIGTDILLVTYVLTGFNNVYGYILTGSAGVYTKGPTYTLVVGTHYAAYAALSCYIGNNQAMLVYSDNATLNYSTAVVISINGTALTVNTKQNITGAVYSLALCQTSTGNALIFTTTGANFTLYALSVSGTTITVGTQANVTIGVASGRGWNALCQSNTNKAILCYWDGSTSVKPAVISVSGTTVTVNTAGSALMGTNSTGAPYIAMCQTNTDVVTAIMWDATNAQYCVIAISSATTTATAGSLYQQSVSASYGYCGIAPTAATNAVCTFFYETDGNYVRAQGFTLAGASNTTLTQSSINNAVYPTTFPSGNVITVGSVLPAAYSSSGRVVVAPVDCQYNSSVYTLGLQATGAAGATTPTYTYSVGTGSSTAAWVSLTSAAYGTGTCILGYSDSGGLMNARIATATAYSIAFGTAVTSGFSGYVSASLTPLSSSSWLMAYANTGTSNYVNVVTASGTTVTVGTSLQIPSTAVSNVYSITAASLNSTTALVSYRVSTTSVASQLVSISGTTATLNGSAITTYSAGVSTNLRSTTIGTNAVLAFGDYLTPYYCKAVVAQYVKE